MRTLIAVPVFNEARSIPTLMRRILALGHDVLAIDDGSTDETAELLGGLPLGVIRHASNRGYGAALIAAFAHAERAGYDWVVTMDCDEQHQPGWTAGFLEDAATERYDVISGSRYLRTPPVGALVPADRRIVNQTLTAEINARLGTKLTDTFCGFKAYRVAGIRSLSLTQAGYAFPMQFWVQAVAFKLRIIERAVDLIYVDLARTFREGDGSLNDPATRLAHYRRVLEAEIAVQASRLVRR